MVFLFSDAVVHQASAHCAKNSYIRFGLCMLSILFLPATAALAEGGVSQFAIERYQIIGNTLLSEAEIQSALKPFTGSRMDFGHVQRALETLQTLYASKGFGTVQVILPEQELKQGVVQLKAIQQKVATVSVEGNAFRSAQNILRTLPGLQAEEVPNTRLFERSLKLANENPSKQTTLVMKESVSQPDSVDATLKVTDQKPSKIFATVDNSGNDATGNFRIGVGYQHYNLWDRDHRFSMQYLTSNAMPEEMFQKVNVLGLGYSIPLYRLGDSIDFLAAYSDVNAGTVLDGAINVASQGTTLGTRYNLNLPSTADYQHKLVIGGDYKRFKPNTDLGGTNLTPEVAVTPFSLTYAGILRKPQWQVAYQVGWSKNIPMGSAGQSEDLAASPWLADGHFEKFNYNLDISRAFATSWLLHAGLKGQYTSDHLHPGEQFGLGGFDNVRGWKERSFSADKGARLVVDVTGPDFGHILGEKVSLRALVFADKGYVEGNKDVTGNELGIPINISSIGTGLRFAYAKTMAARLDFSVVAEGDKTNNPDAVHTQYRNPGDTFAHFSMAWFW